MYFVCDITGGQPRAQPSQLFSRHLGDGDVERPRYSNYGFAAKVCMESETSVVGLLLMGIAGVMLHFVVSVDDDSFHDRLQELLSLPGGQLVQALADIPSAMPRQALSAAVSQLRSPPRHGNRQALPGRSQVAR